MCTQKYRNEGQGKNLNKREEGALMDGQTRKEVLYDDFLRCSLEKCKGTAWSHNQLANSA